MTSLSDSGYVRDQYRASNNLTTRAALHERFGTAPRKWFDWYFDHLDLPARARVLEVGCGTGALWRENDTRIPPSWQITLSDFSPGMIETTRVAVPRARFAVTDAQSVAFEWGVFDAVLANHMLYHVPDVPRALAEFKRVLRPQGKLFAATNGQTHLRELRALIGEIAGIEQPFLEMQFNLENGAAYLAHYFANVQRFDYDDALVVTEVEPLVAYAMSGVLSSQVHQANGEEKLRRIITDRIARDGAFVITKSVGMFVCA
ncbi:MAG: class I SAM-dependent methyltransferase [Chloroflexi bacterium]|nr:class I SAM-dependent methyltransferase [Chloroflexota bacterium]